MKNFNPYIDKHSNQERLINKHKDTIHAYLTKERILEAMYQIRYKLLGKESTAYSLCEVLFEDGDITLSQLTNSDIANED